MTPHEKVHPVLLSALGRAPSIDVPVRSRWRIHTPGRIQPLLYRSAEVQA